MLDDLNLSLPEGCIMGLIGENGAVKSTTIRLILDLLHKDAGTITILGKDQQDDLRLTKEDIGVVMDEVGIPWCMTANQVGKMMKHTYKNWDDAVYEGLLDKLAIPRGKPFKDFSRGTKMKLGIAVAMSHHSKLLLLDEPTSGLDPVVRDEVVDLFFDFTREADHSILISSHIVSDLERLCDYIAFIHQGRLLLCEEKDRLLEAYGLIRCTKEQLADYDEDAVLGRRETPYGVTALVRRDAIPAGWEASPVSIEELFVFMVKGA
jgi:ABC-2 type transport system ATP-binding protein